MDVSGGYAATYPVEGALFERGLRRADVVVCQNRRQSDLLFSRYGRRGYVVPSLCPFETAASSDQESRKFVMWIARVDDWKQPELFIQLAMRIPEQSFVMVAVASQVNPSQLENVYKAAQHVPNLKVLPAVPLHETGRLFREAAVFVNTSRMEGFPNTYLQAAASGTPIVSWAVNPDDMLDRYELGFCAKEDWSCFEQSVRLLCRDSGLRTRMGGNGLEYVRQGHDPDVIARTYLKLFTELKSGATPMIYRDFSNSPPERTASEQSTKPDILSPVKAGQCNEVPTKQ
ncbi:MAG: glycosyltransferase family 4 protein [Nitrospira sp.]|nr:glycosyltransferase family 4 protein [Nitrospira sp.]